jgi:5-methylcytosine-specific restriction endonuclease McrA
MLQIPYNVVDNKVPRRCGNTPRLDTRRIVLMYDEVYQPSLFDEPWKSCTKCGVPKPFSEYHKTKRNESGIRERCKLCEKETLQIWRRNNPEKYKAQQHRNLKKNREKRLAMTQRWRENNREYTREYSRNYYYENYERAQESNRRFREANPDYFCRKALEWAKKFPERAAKNANDYRARREGAEGSHTVEEWTELCEFHGNKCLACGVLDKKLTRDHVIPLTLGGGNGIDNIQPLCKPCNSRKHNRIIDFRDGGN